MNTPPTPEAPRPNRVPPWLAFAALLFLGVALHRQSRRIDSLESALARQGKALAQIHDTATTLKDGFEAIRLSANGTPAIPTSPGRTDAFNARLAALENHLRRLDQRVPQRSNHPEVPEYDPALPVADAAEPEPEPEQSAAWSASQATEVPNTPTATDAATAWAPRSQDGGLEWLQAGFASAVEIAEVRVRESFNAGAINRITALMGGAEIVLWEGVAGTSKRVRDFVVRPGPGIVADAITIHLDTSRVPGWNEIDAVELIGRDGSRQWAASARASSSYGAGVAMKSEGALQLLRGDVAPGETSP